MPDEIVDIYDENLSHIGVKSKSEAHKLGLWHRAIHCWIVRPESPGYVLFQKRGRNKKVYPNSLDISAAGHYTAGETAEKGVREIVEELGFAAKYSDLIPLGIKIDVGQVSGHIVREFCDVFLLKENRPPDQYKVNEAEVEGLVQMSIPDGLNLFSGKRSSVRVNGIEYDHEKAGWLPYSAEVTKQQVIPRVDSYYYKVFICSDLLLHGYPHLAI